MSRTVLGLDVGGANLKAAHSTGVACLQPFELWKHPAGLPHVLRRLLRGLPAFDLLAVTMTGELCDCFESKGQGVTAILQAVATAAGTVPVRVWQNTGRFVDLATAAAEPQQTAAANWLALAAFAGRLAPAGPALLLDLGSTTTDLVPLLDGQPVPHGRTDRERLQARELVYMGARRTPLCAFLGNQAAAELFATTQDVYLMLGLLPEDPADRHTADGRPATRAAAHARLARMLCADADQCTADETRQLAEQVLAVQASWLQRALETVSARLPGPLRTLVLAGSGEAVLPRLLAGAPAVAAVPVVSLAAQCGAAISQAACAYAVAMLAAEQSAVGH